VVVVLPAEVAALLEPLGDAFTLVGLEEGLVVLEPADQHTAQGVAQPS